MGVRIIFEQDDLILSLIAVASESASEGIAFDGIKMIFISLNDITYRLENKLATYGGDHSNIENGKEEIVYCTIISEMWNLIDNVNRLEVLLKKIPSLKLSLTPYRPIFKEIRNLRNSFQHVDERIESFFTEMGGSVYGDIFWRYKQYINTGETANYILTGVSRGKRYNGDLSAPPIDLELHKNAVGVYDVQLQYISEMNGKYVPTNFFIDNAVFAVNEIKEMLRKEVLQILIGKGLMVEDKNEKGLYLSTAVSGNFARFFKFRQGKK